MAIQNPQLPTPTISLTRHFWTQFSHHFVQALSLSRNMDTWNPCCCHQTLRYTNAINAAVSTILNCLPLDDDEDIIVGYDCEWNCVVSDNGQVERGEIAVIQIAHNGQVRCIVARHY
jgi:hypothetical protein